MTTPASNGTWDTVPIFGTYKNLDGTPKKGSVVFTLTERIAMADGTVIYPGNGSMSVQLGAETGSVLVNFPASDDPDIFPNDWSIKVEEKLSDGSGKTYFVKPLLANAEGVNLAKVVLPPGTPSAPAPALVKGVPGGVAALDRDGDVVDAAGTKVKGSGGQAGASSWSEILDKPATFPPTIGTTATTAAAGNDPRLSDARSPLPGTVTDASVASGGLTADALVDGSTNAVLTLAERTRLAGVATGASKNDTDANLRARSSHTGTQAISTVSGLQAALDAKAASAHTHSSSDITDLAAVLRNTDAVCRYSGTQPLRNTVTSDSSRRVRWVSSTAPAIGNGYAIDGLDVWEKTS